MSLAAPAQEHVAACTPEDQARPGADEAAAQRAAAAATATKGTGSGMMGAPAGCGKGKDDEDHQRKVLIEADTEGAFGSDELTAPQVIGDDEYEAD